MLLDHRGASLDEVATALANSLQDDKQRLNAAKLIMEAHGLTEQKAVAQIPNITIIIGEKNSSKGILDLVSPNLATA